MTSLINIMATAKRIVILDSFRGIAAIGVVYSHYTHSFRKDFGHSFSASLDIVNPLYFVLLFFMISGFVIFMTVEKCKNSSEFVFRRFSRLYPVFWTCMLITAAVLTLFPYLNDAPSFKRIIINLTMIPRFFHQKAVDSAYWSLLPELLFYIIIYLMVVIKQIKKIYLWGGIWLLISFVNGFFKLRVGDLLFQYAGLFMSGIMFYKLFTGDKRLINHLYIIAGYCLTIINYYDVSPLATPNHTEFLICISVVYLAFYGFIYNKINFLNNKILIFLGYISYPLYLIHQEIGITILLYFKTLGLNGYWTIYIPIVISIILAYLITKLIEKPVMKYAKKLNTALFYSISVDNKSSLAIKNSGN